MKRIIVFCDGTWNEDDSSRPVTSIVRLRDALAHSLDSQSSLVGSDPAKPRVAGLTRDNVEHIVYYDRGVGTGPWLDAIRGGAFGVGLGHNVRQAYRFLTAHYVPGDEIYVFGFSRGAFTARSLVGYLNAVGLLTSENCTPARESQAWQYYRTSPNDRLSGIWSELTPLVHPRERLRVACLGVFDTVGALGIPVEGLRRFNRAKYEFHDVTLSSIADVNLHAIAVDERRLAFQAAVWRKPQFKYYNTVTEQVWFPGVHSDIGGGYFDHFVPGRPPTPSLDDIPFDWMMKRVNAHTHLRFEIPRLPLADAARVPQHESRTGIFRLPGNLAVRSIQNCPLPHMRGVKDVCYDRLLESIGEMIHVSVLERLGQRIPGPNTRTGYAPRNVIAVLKRIEATYGGGPHPDPELKVVDWDGEPISQTTGAAGVIASIARARELLGLPGSAPAKTVA